MKLRTPLQLLLLVGMVVVLGGSSCSWAFVSNPDGNNNNGQGGGTIIIVQQQATFGGSSLSVRLADLPGVTQASAGWDGSGPFFGAWLAGWTGHRRVSRIRFDPARLTLAQLMTAAREQSHLPFVSFYARDAAQAAEARKAWPLGTSPQLILRRASNFVSGGE